MTSRAITLSYGGGTQSIATCVLIVQGRLPKPDCIVFADTGFEASETWEYTSRHVEPMLNAIGLQIEVAGHDLATVGLYSHKGELLLPAFTQSGKLETFCSSEWKASVIRRYLRRKGYGPSRPVTTWIGITRDEIHRVKEQKLKWQKLHWPLLFDLSPALSRADCVQIIQAAGLPTPPKSSCYICPHRQNEQWARLKEHFPDDWRHAVEIDRKIRERDQQGGVFLHHSRLPLEQADLSIKPLRELPLFSQAGDCNSGMCWV